MNHTSFYSWFSAFFTRSHLEWNRIDIRQVWRSDRNLGLRIKGAGKQYDLIVIGGGNFWEMWDSSSRNGTSLNVSYEELKREGLPVFFNALGAEVERGVSPQARSVFLEELEKYKDDPQFFVSVRNDGSIANLLGLGIDVSSITTIPDHAFFLPTNLNAEKTNNKVPRVLVNLAKDMSQVRYSGTLDYHYFISKLSELLADVYSQAEFELMFFAQIPSDIEVGNEMFRLLPDAMIRENGSVVYPNYRNNLQIDFLNFFNHANLVVAQRFHSNIIALVSEADLIGISNHSKVNGLHLEAETNDRNLFPISSRAELLDFTQVFTAERILASLEPNPPETKYANNKVYEQRVKASSDMKSWLLSNNLL